jgi:putative transposase
MPWKECQIVEERLRFIARLLEGDKMAGLCREFGISRKTGYKIYYRYKDCGIDGLTDRSRRPYRQANQLPMQIEKLIVSLKKEFRHWGAPKIRERLRRVYPDVHCPAISTVHAVLDRNGLVKRRKRARYRAQGTALSPATVPNELWCADYKGEFMLADRRYCYPLTISDFASRYLISCDALATTKEAYAFSVFERAFKDFGLPQAIRTDNGIPFACGNALYGLSKLSVWWLRLGIHIERIKPGHPEQNGRHERMHLTLKNEATRPAADNFLQQQARFDDFTDYYNRQRPHQALEMKVPADLSIFTPDRPAPILGSTSSATPFMTGPLQSLNVDASATTVRKSISVEPLPDRTWESSRSMTRSGGVLRFGHLQTGANREPLRCKSVTYVPRINCNLCVRNGPDSEGYKLYVY